MLRFLALLTVSGALLAGPSTAFGEEHRDASGSVEAVVSFTKKAKDVSEFRDVRLVVKRAGVPVVDQALTVSGCGEPFCWPVGVTVRDLDADGEPEILVDVYTAGAHCCTISMLMSWNGREYRRRHHDWLDAGYSIEDLDRDGRPELRTVDARFRYEFASYAGSAFPVQVWQVDGGVFENVTAGFPELIRRDSARWLRIWRGRRGKPQMEPLAPLAAWAAGQELLGRRKTVDRELAVALRRGWLDADEPWTNGRAFIRSLDRFLRGTGYRR